eukprot:TRINITY_DN7484_c0_g1_i1.p1 TRINITY_DN7484_c0_g1~~TRINITY_DN7484_c0_g1_i1.p1  ORF type:complete len:179 (-),score=26.42 TRINITY_DN7484_c0_g1_i1:4-540(-)
MKQYQMPEHIVKRTTENLMYYAANYIIITIIFCSILIVIENILLIPLILFALLGILENFGYLDNITKRKVNLLHFAGGTIVFMIILRPLEIIATLGLTSLAILAHCTFRKRDIHNKLTNTMIDIKETLGGESFPNQKIIGDLVDGGDIESQLPDEGLRKQRENSKNLREKMKNKYNID